MIIKQGACPAPFNGASNGVLKVLLAGDAGFDVNDVATASLQLRRCDGLGGAALPHDGPPGPKIKVVDKNHPNTDDVGCGQDQLPCACNPDSSSDGIDDLSIPFKTSELASVLELDAKKKFFNVI